MRLSVTVVPNARRTTVERIDDTQFRVAVAAAPREGRANAVLIEALSAYFNVPRTRVRIVRGAAARHKIVEIVET